MSTDLLRSSFLGFPVRNPVTSSKNNGNSTYSLARRRMEPRATVKFLSWGHDQSRYGPLWVSQVGGTNLKFSWLGQFGLKNKHRLNCTEERSSRGSALVRSIAPLWKGGLLLVRCSVFVAVISAAGLLVWYGQMKAKAFVEAQLLPSVCSILSEFLQREVDVGKVDKVSPLSISLRSCSIGPHREEFSCGAVPSMKLRLRPFASLRRGKIVIDAVLSHPSVLVAQKEDFSWLGIPSSSVAGSQRHSSAEEGIDNRTKTRRAAREEAAARWALERNEAARKFAEMGYIVPEPDVALSAKSYFKDGPADFPTSASFLCMDGRMHWRDHHCIDMGIEYNSKHADLEESFGVKGTSPGHKFWSRMISNPARHSFKRRAPRKGLSEIGFKLKRRNLELSAAAALAYFQGQNGVKSNDPYTEKGTPPSSGGLDNAYVETTPVKDVKPGKFNIAAPGRQHNQSESVLEKMKSSMSVKVEDLTAELDEGIDQQTEGIKKLLPVTLDSVYFTGGTLMLLGYGDQEPREMDNVDGHVKFENHYGRLHVQLSGSCKVWRSNQTLRDGGWLSTDVFVDTVEQRWHANLKIANLFAPLFERILDIPITWSKGRASGELHICMSRGDTFPNLHGQLNVNGLSFQIVDAPSCFSEIIATLCFRGQRTFLHNASGWFGAAPIEASGDFDLNPEDGEFHLMCQVPCVEVNALMKTFNMKPLLFPVAGLVTATFNCQGPLEAPIFVGSGMISKKTAHSFSEFPPSIASEAVIKNKEAGAVAAFDHIPLSYVSANFTFNTDNSVTDLYGIRASLLDGGDIRGAGNAWICIEGESDDSAIDVNLSGNLSSFDKILSRYLQGGIQLMPFKIGELNGETKLSGSLLKPRFDIKWTAPKAEESFSDARGDIKISHDYFEVSSSSVAFDLLMKIQTSYPDEYWLSRKDSDARRQVTIEGVELDLRMRGFEFFSLISSNTFDSPRSMHVKATGKIKFQGKVLQDLTVRDSPTINNEKMRSLVGEVFLTGMKLNQLMLAPQLNGSLSISHENIKLDATGRPDENLAVEVIGPLWPMAMGDNLGKRTMLSVALQKGQLRANILYQPQYSTNLEVRNLPLDELELASLRGTIQRAELRLNFSKRRGHGMLSVLHPKFSGVLGEALDVAARWSGDVITVEKTVLEQANSKYELQGEYVLPGTRDRFPTSKERDGLLKRAMGGHLDTVISSMGRWRMRLEVPGAEVAEMLPLARLLSRSTDPAVLSRSKDLFIQTLQSVGFVAESLSNLIEAIHGHYATSDEVVLEDITLPGLAELKGRWHGSLDASGGGNGDTMADFDFLGEDWEWGTYKTQRVLAVGAYSNNDGLRLEKIFIQRDNATLHADGTLLGPKTNLHFAVLNFPVGLVPALVQFLESSATDAVHSLRQLVTPIKGILHMEGDLRGSLAKPECDVQVRLLDGVIGGIDLGRAEIVASITSTSRFLFNAKFEPIVQSGHVHIQGSIPVAPIQNNISEEEDKDKEPGRSIKVPDWSKEESKGSNDEISEKMSRDRNEDAWDMQLTECLKGLNWNILDAGEVRVDADIKDGGMMLITALYPYADWLHGNADIVLQVRGTVEQPVVDGSASFHRASVSSPVLRKPLTNLGGTVHVKSNRLCINSLESRVSRKGKLLVKGNLPLKTSESFPGDKIDLKCEVLEVRAKNILSGQVDSQMQITGSILQPNVSGMIKLSHGEAYLPQDKGNGETANRLASSRSSLPTGGYNRMPTSGHVSRVFGLEASSHSKFPQPSGKHAEVEKKMEQESIMPTVDVRLTDLRLLLGPELRIAYPLILNFAVSGELELNGLVHPKRIKPKGILTFENGDVNLVATQVRLKRDHLNMAKFEPELGLDPVLDLALVGSEWLFRIQGRASNWQDNLVVTSTRSVEQDVLSPTEAARVFESQLAGSLLERDGQLAFKKLATATLETLMPRIEGKGEFGQARWRVVYAPQIPNLHFDPTVDPLKSLANSISFGTEVEVQLGKRLQASIVRQIKDSEKSTQLTLIYQLTSRLRVLFHSSPSNDSNRLLFEYSATSQD